MEKKTRVLFWYWGRKGGGARYAAEIGKEFWEQKELDVYYSLSRQGHFFEELSHIPDDHCCHIDTYQGWFSAVVASFRLFGVARKLRGFVEKKKIEVVYCPMTHIWNPLLLELILPKGTRFVLTVHDALLHPGEDNVLRSALIDREIKRADAFIVLSEHVRASLESRRIVADKEITVVPHSVFDYVEESDQLRVRELPRDREVRLLFFGRFLPYKGISLLLKACRAVVEQGWNMELELSGRGDLTDCLEEIDTYPGKIRIENRWIEEDEIFEIFDRSDIVVVPYVEASQSGVIPISIGMGLPCVVTPVGGLIEQVADGRLGLISEQLTPEAFAEAVTRLLRAPELYYDLSKACLDAARDLSWSSAARKIAAELMRLTTEAPRSV